MSDAEATVRAYYAAFNAGGDRTAMLDLLAEDVAHDISQGVRETGRAAFARFMAHMDRCYRETLLDIVVMTEPTGMFAAAEFSVRGTYLASDPGVPAGTAPARGQEYTIPAGAFLTLRDGKIARVATHYNLANWVTAVA